LPLFEKARIEAYLPDASHPAYSEFLATLKREFTFAFGGCSLMRGLEGSYLSRSGTEIPDRVNVLYADAPFNLRIILKLSPTTPMNCATLH
jgi:hypothetical protein